MLKVFEAFAGIGSQTQALKNIGVEHEVVAISEIDKYAIASYEAIHGPTKNLGDISKLKDEDIPEHDLFTYSFPCQDISLAGKQRGLDEGSGTRSSLLWECERVIRVARPKYLLLENVKNLVSKKHKHNFDEWLKILESYEYNNYWKVLNAKDYGVPQNRERVFVVSIRKDVDNETFEFPKSQELKLCLKDMLENEVDEKFYLSKEIQDRFVYKPSDDENESEIPLEEKPETGRLGKQSVDTFNENINNISYGDVIQPFNKKVKKDVVPTLTTRPEGLKTANIIVNKEYRIRKLTPRECWRLMGFKDEQFNEVEKVCSNTQLYKQAGNSIVVNVLEAIFSKIFLV